MLLVVCLGVWWQCFNVIAGKSLGACQPYTGVLKVCCCGCCVDASESIYVPAVLNVLNCVASTVHGRKKLTLYRLAMAMGLDSQRLHKHCINT